MSATVNDVLAILAADYQARATTDPSLADADKVGDWLYHNVPKTDTSVVAEARNAGKTIDADDDGEAKYVHSWRTAQDKKYASKPSDGTTKSDKTTRSDGTTRSDASTVSFSGVTDDTRSV